MTESRARRLRQGWLFVLALLLGGGAGCGWLLTRYPEFRVDVAIREADETPAVREDRRARAQRLQDDVEAIAFERSHRKRKELERARGIIEQRLRSFATADGKVELVTHAYPIEVGWLEDIRRRAHDAGCVDSWNEQKREMLDGVFHNIELVVRGTEPKAPAIVVGAHYDSDACESKGVNPGADDNASGVAALIELASMAAAKPRARTIRFVAFTNEEEPFFHTPAMGSLVYACALTDAEVPVAAMLSLETLGFYADEAGSQDTLGLLGKLIFGLPDTGNYVAVVGNHRSASLVERVSAGLRGDTKVRVEGIAAWAGIQGIDWSDHWSFWQIGVPALMITDTAPNRNRCYHRPCDRPDRLDYGKLAEVVAGLHRVLDGLADEPGVALAPSPADCRE